MSNPAGVFLNLEGHKGHLIVDLNAMSDFGKCINSKSWLLPKYHSGLQLYVNLTLANVVFLK